MKRIFTMPGERQPVLETERLTLRAFRHEDAKTVCRLAGDWEVARMMAPVPYPYPLAAAGDWIRSHGQSAADGIDLTFAIWLKDVLIGSINIENRGDDTVGIGYWIGKDYWSKGYASEAVTKILRYAFGELSINLLLTDLFADNLASARVLEKAGFTFSCEKSGWSEARQETCPKREYRLTQERWQAQKGLL
ncbi:GNAT family N-acetyltransferase [Parvibaculaceae bacterium PLY_AMNH_Bact1]|nr:GNAT family N-acetyltransferase [Parvibaculaceae bacterium PLY_AMNH_Bact1]